MANDDGQSFRARQRCVPFPATLVAAQCATVVGARFAAIPAVRRDQFNAPRRQLHAERITFKDAIGNDAPDYDAVSREDVTGSRRPTRAFLLRAALRWAMRSKAAFPEEHAGVDTTIHFVPLPRLVFPALGPLFCRSKTAVREGLVPIDLLALVQLRRESAPDGEPDFPLFTIATAWSTRGRRGNSSGTSCQRAHCARPTEFLRALCDR